MKEEFYCENCDGRGDTNIGASICFMCGGSGFKRILQADCLEVLRKVPDKRFDLVLTDPPYGIGLDKGTKTTYGSSTENGRQYEDEWDGATPVQEVFDEILRVSKLAVIFGGQFFADKLPANGHWIVWDKKGSVQFDNPFGDCELAWTNAPKKSVKKYTVIQQGFVAEERDRYHPTQKPVSLFAQILRDYAKEGDTVLDPFLGSGTTLVAAKSQGLSAVGIEINPKFCEIARKRLEQEQLF